MDDYSGLINTFDVDTLRKQVEKAEPFPFFYVDNFLNEDFANDILNAFPSYDEALNIGRSFKAVNEIKKVQVTDAKLFPEPIAKLNALLQSKAFIEKLGKVLNIPNLIPDPSLVGGGIHETQGGGRLDVHVDFNFNDKMGLYRRANILIYFNKDWKKEYGGILDFWDTDVKKCYAEIIPVFNRMACFATSEISYHGVTPIKCPDGMVRKSFAAYYYSPEPSENYTGQHHSTIFKARPDEWVQAYIKMPAENTKIKTQNIVREIKQIVKKLSEKIKQL